MYLDDPPRVIATVGAMSLRSICTFVCMVVVALWTMNASGQTTRPFATGVDVNYALNMQSRGRSWRDANGAEVDPFKLLADASCDSIRVRLWTSDEGMNGLTYATDTALRAQRAGLKPYVVIFLSENWADMVKQPAPAIWKALSLDDRCRAIEAYAERVTKHLIDRGVNVDTFEIGNEIDFGLCGVFEEEWPKRVSVEYMRARIWSQMLPMIRAAQSGVRKAKPDAKFILHLARWDEPAYATAFWQFMMDGGAAVDYLGLSYFPTSQPDAAKRSIAFLETQLASIAKAIPDRPILICETAHPTSTDFGGQFGDWNKPIDGYPLSEAGQAAWLGDFLRAMRANERVAGIYYWSPEWYEPGMWESFALFDQQSRARPAMQSFNARSPATQPTTQRVDAGQPTDREGYRVYLGNLHGHTAVSDGTGTPREAYAYARDVAKLDFLALTEHNHLMGGEKAPIERRRAVYAGPDAEAVVPASHEFTQDGSFVALAGQEFSSMSKGNHVSVFDVGEVIDPNDVPNGDFAGLLRWLDQHRDSDGNVAVLQLNHPALGRPGKTIDANEYGRDDFGDDAGWLAHMVPATHLIELLNGEPPEGGPRRAPQMMEKHYRLYLKTGFRVAPTGNQDNHKKQWGTITDVRTGIVAKSLTRKDLLDAMRARHVYASEDRDLRFIARIDGRLCGDVVSVSRDLPAKLITIECSIVDADERDAEYTVELFAGRVGKALAESIGSWTTHGNTPADRKPLLGSIATDLPGRYFYLRITQSSPAGTDYAWTAPVWFDAQP
jgi:arabinogalactan endo-1,4-beta-galactosidase